MGRSRHGGAASIWPQQAVYSGLQAHELSVRVLNGPTSWQWSARAEHADLDAMITQFMLCETGFLPETSVKAWQKTLIPRRARVALSAVLPMVTASRCRRGRLEEHRSARVWS